MCRDVTSDVMLAVSESPPVGGVNGIESGVGAEKGGRGRPPRSLSQRWGKQCIGH